MTLTSRLYSRFRVELAASLISAVAGALLIVFLARKLTPDAYGLLFLAISIVGTAQFLAKLGIARSAARYISEYKEQNPGQVRHILKSSITYNLLAIFIVSVVFLFSHKILADIFDEEGLQPLLLLGVLYLGFGTLSTYVRVILQGFEEIKQSAIIHLLEGLSRLTFCVGLVLLGFGAIGAMAGYVLSFLVTMGVGFLVIYYRFYREYRESAVDKELRRRLLTYSIPLTMTNAADILDKRIDIILVGFFLNPLAVSFYVLAKQVVNFLRKPADALGFTISPSLSADKAQGNINRARQIYEITLVHSLLLYIPAAAGLVLISEIFINFAFDGGYTGAIPVLQILCLFIILQAITVVTSDVLDFLGRARTRAVAKILTSIFNFILNLFLIPLLGVIGAAIATVFTYSLYTLANLYIINLELDLRIRYLFAKISKIIFMSLIMSVIVFFIISLGDGILVLASAVTVGVCVWAITSFLMGLINPDRIQQVLR